MEERTKFQNVILIILAVMVVLFGVLTGVMRGQKGVLFQETLLKVTEAESQTAYTGKIQGVPVVITVTGIYDGYASHLDLSRSDVAYFARGPELTARGSWGLYFLMALLTGLLALDVLFPKALFYMNHACDVRDPEPSDFYLAMQKVSWVIYPCFLLGGYIYVLTGLW